MRQRTINIPAVNDNRSERQKFVELIVSLAVSMEAIGEPQYNREVARRVATRAIDLMGKR